MRFTGCIAVALALFLYACGGGDGGSSPVTMDPDQTPTVQPAPNPGPDPDITYLPFPLGLTVEANSSRQHCLPACPYHYDANFETIPKQTVEDAQRAPVYSEFPLSEDGRQVKERLFVGIHQGDEHLGSLPANGFRGNTRVLYGRLNDGVDADLISNYLEGVLLGDGRIRRHASPPVLRVVGTVEPEHIERLVRAVQLVNATLPPDWRITMPSDSGMFESGSIEVEFVPYLSSGAGITHYWVDVDNAETGLDRARIEIDRNQYVARSERLSVQVLAHEIIHSLGALGHLPESFDTVLEAHNPGPRQAVLQPLSILYTEDREALRALYGVLENGDAPSADLGPWDSTSLHIAGNGAYANFGVAIRNGYAEAWAHGQNPGEFCCGYGLADNQDLSGTVIWSGALLGFAQNAETVAGDAEISVNLVTLTGHADFTNLERWAEQAAPGEAGTGSMWLDGDLGYAIAVDGNTFRETGGDDGILTGIFTGANHEGAAGTLERSDLTAAFGASR